MKRNIVKLAMVVALFTGFVVAQNPGSQSQPDQSQQMPQTQQQPTPETQQVPQSQTQTGTPSQSIQSQIQQQPELSGVTVNESSDKIELSGTVASKADKEKAKSIAESSSGGRKVVNKIKVNGSSTSTPSTTPPPPQY
jgi:osmotically-inducible protein OsmY